MPQRVMSTERGGCDLKSVIFKHSVGNDILLNQVNIALEWMPEDLTGGMSTLV